MNDFDGGLIETTGIPDSPSRIVARNTVIILARQIANWLIILVLVLLVPRYLGDVGLGRLQFGQSFASLVSIGVGLGMGRMVTREIARSRDDAQALLRTAMTVRLISAAIAMGVVLLVVWLSGIRGEAAAVVYVSSASMLLLSMSSVGVSVLHGHEDMGRVAIASTVSKLIAAGIGVAVLLTGQGVFEYALSVLAGSAIYTSLVLIAGYREMPTLPGFSRHQARRLLTGAIPFAVTSGVLTLYNQVDSIMVRSFSGEAVLGWHSAATRIVGATEILPAAIATALMPTIARTHVSDRQASLSLSKRAVGVSAAMLVPLGFLLAANAERLMELLPIPDVFVNSAPVLSVLAISIPVTATLMIAGAVATGTDRQRIFMLAMASGLVINLALNSVLIPLYDRTTDNGGTGAAIATLSSEVVILLFVFRVLAVEAFGRSGMLTLLKVGIAAGAMGLVAWLLSETGAHPLLWNAVALVLYIVLIPVFRIVTRSDAEVIWESIRRRRSGASDA